MLKSVCVPHLANTDVQFTGLDSPGRCLDQSHWNAFADKVHYHYNSRGFRDQEWPTDLTNAVWCVGDSFTSGLGSAWHNTWPQILQRQLGMRTINVSLDGASNNWIARQCMSILQTARPLAMVVMWSYLHRREGQGQQRLLYSGTSSEQDYQNLLQCQQQVRKACVHTQLAEFIVPNWQPVLSQTAWQHIRDSSWPGSVNDLDLAHSDILAELQQVYGYDLAQLTQQITNLGQYPVLNTVQEVMQQDRARDGHHFDCVTAHWIVDCLCALPVLGLSPIDLHTPTELDHATDVDSQA